MVITHLIENKSERKTSTMWGKQRIILTFLAYLVIARIERLNIFDRKTSLLKGNYWCVNWANSQIYENPKDFHDIFVSDLVRFFSLTVLVLLFFAGRSFVICQCFPLQHSQSFMCWGCIISSRWPNIFEDVLE